MTPAQQATLMPDLRAVRLGELPVLAPASLDQVLRRVMPGTPVSPALGTAFASSI